MLSETIIIYGRNRGATLVVAAAVFLALLIGVTTSPFAQEPTEPAQDAPPQKSAVVPPAQIVEQAKETSTRLKSYNKDLSPRAFVAEIDTLIVDIEAEIDELVRKTDMWTATDLGLSALEEIQREWTQLDGKLANWIKQLDSRITPLQKRLAEIGADRTRWKNTRTEAAESELSQSLIETIDSVIEELANTQKLIEERINEITAVKNKVDEERIKTTERLKNIGQMIDQARLGVLTANEPPIWKAFQRAPRQSSHTEQAADSWRWVVTSIKQFFAMHKTRTLWHAAVFAALLVLMIVLRLRSSGWDLDATSRQTVDQVLKNPAATAVLISLLLTRPMYPNAPTVVFELSVLASVPILALFVPRLLPRGIVKSVYALFGVIFFFPILELIAVGDLITRLLILVLSGVAIAILAKWSRADGPATNISGRLKPMVVLFVSRVGAFLMIVAFAANIVGIVALAELLFTGTLVSAYTAVLLFVTVRILGVLATATLNSGIVQSFASVRKNRYLIKRRALGLFRFLGLISWVIITLRFFGAFGAVKDNLTDWLTTRWTLGSMNISVGAIVAFFVALWASVLVSRLVRTVLKEDVLPKTRLARGMPETISLIVNYAIVGIGFFIALAVAGIKISEFAIVFGAFGVGIGFGLQTIVNNFISGLVLIFERPIQVGDTVELGTGDLVGVVRRIGIRASTVRTFAGAEVIIPNGDLLAGQVTNWTLSDINRRIDVLVGVAYGTDPEKVISLLLDVAHRQEGVLEDPEPTVIFRGFGESSLDFELRAWTASERWFALKSDLTVKVNRAIVDSGIEIPFPQRDLHLRSVDANAGGTLTGNPPPRPAGSDQQPTDSNPDSNSAQPESESGEEDAPPKKDSE
jgi:small-conductance mechanosensitive channel